jgi:hypothetical protein
MSSGGKKDATYVAKLFEPHLEQLDPHKNSVDLFYFDGASNVQKAGRILCAKYPRATCLHGAEHVVALFFSDILKIPKIKLFVSFYKRLYGVFGSGSQHAPHAIFMKQSRLHNAGKAIGLIRAADTRMAGYIIAFLRLLRLKPVVDSTVSSPEFIRLQIETEMLHIMRKPEYWSALLLITRAVFSGLRVLRLADMKVTLALIDSTIASFLVHSPFVYSSRRVWTSCTSTCGRQMHL